jgi:hypothetical protein
MSLIVAPVLRQFLTKRRTRLTRKARRLLSADGWLFVKSAILLALTRLSLSVCRFQMILAWLSRLSTTPAGGDLPAVSRTINRIEWAVSRASRCVPGTRHCLTQALAAKLLLARRGVLTQLRIGVAKDQAGLLRAHAWLESDGAAIFGVPNSGLEEYCLLPHLDRA